MKRALFLHIPKTAGTSIQAMARALYGNDEVCSHDDYRKLELEKIARLKFVSGHFGIGLSLKVREERYFFTFLRDPRERLISLFRFYKGWRRAPARLRQFMDTLSFEDFLRLGAQDMRPRLLDPALIWNTQVCQLSLHTWGAATAPNDLRPELLKRAKSNLQLFDAVGLVETFEVDIRRIFGDLGVSPIKISYSNVSEMAELKPTLAEEKLLEQVTELDRELYSHAQRSTVGR
jgi:hypothetical protein